MTSKVKLAGSFRDPSGFIFNREGRILRQINKFYKEDYDELINSGLYEVLTEKELLVPHQEIDEESPDPAVAYKIIKPEPIDFISYPYEWCFSQLQNAALLTLKIQKLALKHNMSLKDSSAYNVQFLDGRPILIDTLSFEKYNEGNPWIAFRQFCQHFLAPLALMAYTDIRLNSLFRIHIDGIPLDLASKLLTKRTYLKFSLFSYIHLHAKSQSRYAGKDIKKTERKMSRQALLGVIDTLESAVKKLNRKEQRTEWAEYYDDTNYSKQAFEFKRELVSNYLEKIKPNNVWDLGANRGIFSRISSNKGITTISFDIDPLAVEFNYQESIKKNETKILPLILDLTNPSSGIGWHNQERMSLLERGPANTVMALALIHHLAISNNLPLMKIADFFSDICQWLIIEFVPKNDSQVQRLLRTREDIFPDYTKENFIMDFDEYFDIVDTQNIKGSDRDLFLMKRKL